MYCIVLYLTRDVDAHGTKYPVAPVESVHHDDQQQGDRQVEGEGGAQERDKFHLQSIWWISRFDEILVLVFLQFVFEVHKTTSRRLFYS